MSPLVAELPEDLRDGVIQGAALRGLSEIDWLAQAAREKLAAERELADLEDRASRGDRAAYDRILDRVPVVSPDPGDEF